MNLLAKVFSMGGAKLFESIGDTLDSLTTSKDEKLEAKRKIRELIISHEVELEKNITERWEADMQSDSWLAKNVRPAMLVFLVVSTITLMFVDAGYISFVVEQKWTDLLQIVLITVIGAYFGGRSLEKIKK